MLSSEVARERLEKLEIKDAKEKRVDEARKMFCPSGRLTGITTSAASATGEALCVRAIVGIPRSRNRPKQRTSSWLRPVKDEPKTTVPGSAAAASIRLIPWSFEAEMRAPRRNSRFCNSFTIIDELPPDPKA